MRKAVVLSLLALELAGCTLFETKHRIATFDREAAYHSCLVTLGWTYASLTAECGRPYRATTGDNGTIVLIYRTYATAMAPTRYLALTVDNGNPRRVISSEPLTELPADVSLQQ